MMHSHFNQYPHSTTVITKFYTNQLFVKYMAMDKSP